MSNAGVIMAAIIATDADDEVMFPMQCLGNGSGTRRHS
jgi:hypothetical protein